MKYLSKYLLTVLLAVLVFLFWFHEYPSVLSYQEQYQMFLFDSDYFLNRLAVPGGLADYMAEFLTQFYVSFWIGSLILAILFVVFQLLTWQMAKCYEVAEEWFPISFIPAILLWFLMSDENIMLTFLVALDVLLFCVWITILINNKYLTVLTPLLTPLLYWAIGPAGLFYGPMVLLCKKAGYRKFFVVAFGVSCLTIVSAQDLVNYPLYRLVQGIDYYRFPEYNPILLWVVMLLTACIGLLSYLPKFINKTGEIILTLIVLVGGCILVPSSYDSEKYDLIEYDCLVRGHKWNAILEKAEKKNPDSPMGVAAVNLALAMRGELSDRLFEFYQNGGDGLFPQFQRDFTSPLITNEVFFELGMINTSQRYVFEAQEAIPNFRKSCRLTKRLAETNLINGQYKVARKYLRRLQKTLFYHNWANQTLALLGNEDAINQHPVYGEARKKRLKKDFLFSDEEPDQMMGFLFLENPKNKMAFEYLLSYELLQRDMQKFMQYYPLGKYADYNHIPRSFQEALVFMWTQSHKTFDGMPWSISQLTQQEVVNFAQIYQTNPQDPRLDEGRMKSSFWNYYLLKGNQK